MLKQRDLDADAPTSRVTILKEPGNRRFSSIKRNREQFSYSDDATGKADAKFPYHNKIISSRRRSDAFRYHFRSGASVYSSGLIGHRWRDSALTFSNHEEAVSAVTPKLFDETIFPIEIGLHCLS
jgi:hypothetical protein